MTNTIVCQVHSPDGKVSALLVERYYHSALNANQFYLLVIPKEQDTAKALNDEGIGDSSALVATKARRVVLRWQDSGTLVVICDSCGIEAIDVSKKLDHLGFTKIIYQGFSKHTAYS
ncbi:MAG TPA: hypothetical protein VGD64_10335 [Acidisarcina sp.]